MDEGKITLFPGLVIQSAQVIFSNMKKVILVLYLGLFANVVSGQLSFDSLEELLRYSDEHAFAIQSAQLQEEIAIAQSKQSRAFLYPSINGISGYTNNLTIQPTLVPMKLFNPGAPDGTFEEMTFGRQHIYNTGLVVQWDILNFQRIFAAQAATIEKTAAVLHTEDVRYSFYNQLANTYYSIVLLQYSVNLYSENVSLTDTLLRSSREKYQKGIISEAELNTVSMQHMQNEKILGFNRNQLQQLLLQLQAQLGTTEELLVTGNPEALMIDLPDIKSPAPQVKWQESQVQLYEALLKQNKSLLLPNISLNYQYNQNWASDSFFNFSNANRLPSQVFGVKMSVPLFNGFSSKDKVDELKVKLRFQHDQLKQVKLEQAKADETLILRYHQTQEASEKSRQILQLQQVNDRYTESKYDAGLISLDERMNKYNELLNAQESYLQSLADFSLVKYQVYIRQKDFHQPLK